MSFLSIAFLAALPLAAAPILLHLFDRRRNVTIEWGAMQFLMEAATLKARRRRVKQWLLLMLRTAAVAALVLALARPMLPGSWFHRTGQTETLLILDNSMSMSRSVGEQTVFDAAIDRAVETVGELQAGDALRVLLASPYPVWGITGSVRVDAGSRGTIEDRLRELRPTAGRSDLLAALLTAVQTGLEPAQHRRRIVVLTDGQGTDWSADDEAGWSRFREVLKSQAVPTELEIVDLEMGEGVTANIAVDRIESRRTVVGVDQPFAMTAHIHNYSDIDAGPASVTWWVGNRDKDKRHLHESYLPGLPAGQQQDVICKHSFSRPGVYAISCAIDSADNLATDNTATVVVEVVEQVPVSVIESASHLAEMQQDAYFVRAALGWIDDGPLAVRGVHRPTLVDPGRPTNFDLAGQHAVVIPNLLSLSPEAVSQLEAFVAAGGGLWIALGPRTDADLFNQRLFADGNGLAPLALDQIIDETTRRTGTEGRRGEVAIEAFLDPHPATAQLADNERLDLADVTIDRRFRFVPPPEEEAPSVLLRLTNGEPLAVEKFYGQGRVIVQSIPLRLQWSELARSQAFVVMVQDWLSYLTEPSATRHNLQPGDPLSMELADTDSREATLITPLGDEISLTGEETSEGVRFRSSRTTVPGDYLLEVDLSGDGVPFHVRRDPRESDLSPLSVDDRRLLADVSGLAQTTFSDTMQASNQQDALWPVLLMILIGAMAAELLLAGIISRERFGSEPIRETSGAWSDPSAGASDPRLTRGPQQTAPTDAGQRSSPSAHPTTVSQQPVEA